MNVLLGDLEKGILFNLGLENGFKERTATWLSENHPDIWNELDFHEGGDIIFDPTGNHPGMMISGDNGILLLRLIKVDHI
jgi:hypothetical protein